jgi:hypothetical protein
VTAVIATVIGTGTETEKGTGTVIAIGMAALIEIGIASDAIEAETGAGGTENWMEM